MAKTTGIHVPSVILGVFIDQIGSFALGAIIALFAASATEAFSHGIYRDLDVDSLAQLVYEFGCLGFGVIGGLTAARLAKRSMVAHGLAVGVASLCVSTVLGVGMSERMFDARGIMFAALALLAAVFGGWLASLKPVRRLELERA
jgi:hypothetical protein